MTPARLDIDQPPHHRLTLVRIPTTGALYLYQYERDDYPANGGLAGWSLVAAVKVRPQDTATLVGFIARTAHLSCQHDHKEWIPTASSPVAYCSDCHVRLGTREELARNAPEHPPPNCFYGRDFDEGYVQQEYVPDGNCRY